MTEAQRNERRVLLVEDNPDLAESMTFALAAFGWSVTATVATSLEALESVSVSSFEIAVLDVDLGDELSYPVADELKRRGVPFIFLTGFVARDEMPERFSEEVCLTKPVVPESLIEALEALLSGDAVHKS